MRVAYAYDVVNAVLAADSDDVVDAAARAEAVSKVRGLGGFRIDLDRLQAHEEYSAAGAEKTKVLPCASNPLGCRKSGKGTGRADAADGGAVEKLRGARDYEEALLEIAKLRPAIDKFFDKVMVMVDDENLRANRLALLQTLVKEFSTIADFSEIVTEGKESTK